MIKFLCMAILLAILLAFSTSFVNAGTFLDEITDVLPTESVNQWQSSPYTEDAAPIQSHYSGSECTNKTQTQLNRETSKQNGNSSECYITEFPDRGIETHIQSTEQGDFSVGVKWEID
ncbi:hypothetical protein L1D31_04915 [Vibrio sp. Isolate23]|uniref:hypothetical protein n=1 Tax=Vibrio sp. Isolate23 TaxID=2908533 RepID=UPI001EFCE97B|nr:hypothetical protein [Vibrio sp. Isolate23]MCG9681905.1 hypothetical protein [Vibrio sp. Isolate23]